MEELYVDCRDSGELKLGPTFYRQPRDCDPLLGANAESASTMRCTAGSNAK